MLITCFWMSLPKVAKMALVDGFSARPSTMMAYGAFELVGGPFWCDLWLGPSSEKPSTNAIFATLGKDIQKQVLNIRYLMKRWPLNNLQGRCIPRNPKD